MSTYSTQQKESALQKMMPPNNISISKLSIEMGIGESTPYTISIIAEIFSCKSAFQHYLYLSNIFLGI
jgi:hypothetical protein